MTDAILGWWKRNGGVIIVALVSAMTGAGFAGIVWGVTLQGRVATLEAYGSPQAQAIDKRLTRVEERQNVVLDTLRYIGTKVDSISEELRKHEIETNKPR